MLNRYTLGLDFSQKVAGVSGNPIRHLAFKPIIQYLSKTRSSINVLEVGVWVGYSTCSWIAAIKQIKINFNFTVIDNWNPNYDQQHLSLNNHYNKMNALAKEGLAKKTFLNNISKMGAENKVKVLDGHSERHMKLLPSESFDLIYIDGDHRLEQVRKDLQEASRLLKMGGILVGDDLELQKFEIEQSKLEKDLASGLEWISMPDIIQSGYHPGVTQAVSEFFNEVGHFNGLYYVIKNYDGWGVPDLSLPNALSPFYIHPLDNKLYSFYKFLRANLFRLLNFIKKVKNVLQN